MSIENEEQKRRQKILYEQKKATEKQEKNSRQEKLDQIER